MHVGPRTGAPTVGSGGNSILFTMALSPTPMVTFPVPATSNAACRSPALRFPVDFTPRFMRPIVRERFQSPSPTPPLPCETPASQRQRLSVFTSVQILLLRSCKLDAFIIPSLPPVLSEEYQQQGAFTPRALPRFIANILPSATLSPSVHFPVSPVIGPTLLQGFLPGTRRASPVA